MHDCDCCRSDQTEHVALHAALQALPKVHSVKVARVVSVVDEEASSSVATTAACIWRSDFSRPVEILMPVRLRRVGDAAVIPPQNISRWRYKSVSSRHWSVMTYHVLPRCKEYYSVRRLQASFEYVQGAASSMVLCLKSHLEFAGTCIEPIRSSSAD